MKVKTLMAYLACGGLVLAAACQDTPVAVDDGLSPSFANVHLKGGAKAAPEFTDLGISLRAAGDLSGLGNEDLVIFLTADADVVAVCQNQGGNQAPGQNPAPLTVTGTKPVLAEQIKNGNLSFELETEAPPRLIPGAPDCPNPNWDEIVIDLIFRNATIRVEQPIGTEVFNYFTSF